MKKINYSSQSLCHIISNAIVIVLLLLTVACFLVSASERRIILYTILTINVFGVIYAFTFLIVDTFLAKLKHEHDKKQKHPTT